MIEYWSVVGRLVVDEGFQERVSKCEHDKDHQKLVKLYEFLCGPFNDGCALRLSRWELCDASRTAAFLAKENGSNPTFRNHIDTLRAAWKCAALPTPQETLEPTAWLGLLLIDAALRERYLKADCAAKLEAAIKNPPVFHLTGKGGKMDSFLKYRVDNRSTQQALGELTGKSWIPPGKSATALAAAVMGISAFLLLFKSGNLKVQCSGGQTQLPLAAEDPEPYIHLLPPFVDQLAARLLPQRVAGFLGI